jgi:uncharacterized phage protein (TIGR02218 family)
MKSLPAALLAHYGQDVTTLALCWTIEKSTGEVIRSTDHDRDIVITTGELAGRYVAGANITGSDIRSTADMAVDNMEVEGAFPNEWVIPDLTVAEIEAGVLDNAPVTVFVVNWQSPDDGQNILRCGYLGALTRDSDGRYRTEVRGLTQRLSQNIGQTYSERCNVVEFGDSRCKFDVAGATRTVEVVSVTNRRRFDVQITSGSAPPTATYFDGAKLTFTSGANQGFFREVKRAADNGGVLEVSLWEELPADVEVGDTATLPPACNRLLETCRDVHNNIVNFRGYGVFIPGVLALMKGPT